MTAPDIAPGAGPVAGTPGDRPFERAVGRILAVGVAVASLLLILGIAVDAIAGGPGLDAVGGVPRAVPATGVDWAASLLFAGLLLLVLTPVARVAGSLLLYARRADRAFVGITLFVLVLLVATVLVGVLR